MTISRAHHYVPVFYLKGFTSPTLKDREYLWVYEQGKRIRKSKPVNEAHQRDFYSFEDENGQRRDLEQPLSGIESVLARFFRVIDDPRYHRFHPDEFEGLTIFMALMWVRGPFGRDLVNQLSAQVMKAVVRQYAEDAEKFQRVYDDVVEQYGTKPDVSAEEVRSSILNREWNYEQKSSGYTLHKMFQGVPVVSGILRQKAWEVLTSEGDDYFCTSDCPVITILPDGAGKATIGAGFGVPGVRVYFPLTKRSCLVLKDRARCIGRVVPRGMVQEINKFLMVGARRFLYACEKNTAMEKLFNKIGCKSVPGENAFMRDPAPTQAANQL